MNTTDYKTYHYQWASNHVTELAKKLCGDNLDTVVDGFNEQAIDQPELALAAKDLFESRSHDRLYEGVNMTSSMLFSKTSVPTDNIHLTFVDQKRFRTLESLTLKGIKERVYYRPRYNLATADSFAVVGTTVYLFQITFNAKHGAKIKGLEALVSAIDAAFPVDREQKLEYRLVFVIPSQRADEFSYQGWQYGGRGKDKYIENSEARKRCQQQVAIMPPSTARPLARPAAQ